MCYGKETAMNTNWLGIHLLLGAVIAVLVTRFDPGIRKIAQSGVFPEWAFNLALLVLMGFLWPIMLPFYLWGLARHGVYGKR